MIIKSLVDTDLYKYTMMGFVFHQYPKTEVKYEFVCRNKEIDLRPYAEEIKAEILHLTTLQLTEEELNYLEHEKGFKSDFINYLKTFKLNSKDIKVSVKNEKLSIEVAGLWLETILWEVPVLAIVNEVYFRNINSKPNYQLGIKKLNDKIELVKKTNETHPLQFVEFGSRRRFSAEWQDTVVSILSSKLTEKNFLGTSNIHLGMKYGIKVYGTFAHETFSAMQALSSYETAQEETLRAWIREYGDKYNFCLTDIYTTEAFFATVPKDLVQHFNFRQDSGDPLSFIDKTLELYKKHGIDPLTKEVMPSDGLNFPKAIKINEYAWGKFKRLVAAIGTDITNDVDSKSINIVMKMVECNGKPVIKISDEPSKAVGNKETIEKVKKHFNIN